MKQNVGKTDKIVRLVIAFAIALAYYFKYIEGTLATVLLIVAIVLALTSFLNFCPAYALLGFNSKEK